jgi:hypothetical protein
MRNLNRCDIAAVDREDAKETPKHSIPAAGWFAVCKPTVLDEVFFLATRNRVAFI